MENKSILHYPVIYRDSYGLELPYFESNGSHLTIELRGIRFSGKSFDCLEPDENTSDLKKIVKLDQDQSLTAFQMDILVPVIIIDKNEETERSIKIRYSKEPENEGTIEFLIEINGIIYKEISVDFENGLSGLQKQFPSGIKLKLCFFCRFSHYHPCGNGIFGDLYCFVKSGTGADKISSKTDLLDWWNKKNSQKIFPVQEIYFCPLFDPLTSKHWCYKNWNG